MKNIQTIISLALSIVVLNCRAQSILRLNGITYKGYTLNKTLNQSFVNKKFIFTSSCKDTIYLNQKLPFDVSKTTFYDQGIYYNCHLQRDTIYTIELKKINLESIPSYFNNYYRTNALFVNKNSPSKYVELAKNTKFLIKGYYVKYFDIDNEIYEIISLSPVTNCGIAH